MNDFFNLDDLNDRNWLQSRRWHCRPAGPRAAGRTTAGFFFLYGSLPFEWLVGAEYAVWVAALVGTAAIDGMAFAWPRMREGHASTDNQMTAASIGTAGNMGISVLITASLSYSARLWISP